MCRLALSGSCVFKLRRRFFPSPDLQIVEHRLSPLIPARVRRRRTPLRQFGCRLRHVDHLSCWRCMPPNHPDAGKKLASRWKASDRKAPNCACAQILWRLVDTSGSPTFGAAGLKLRWSRTLNCARLCLAPFKRVNPPALERAGQPAAYHPGLLAPENFARMLNPVSTATPMDGNGPASCRPSMSSTYHLELRLTHHPICTSPGIATKAWRPASKRSNATYEPGVTIVRV